MDYVRKKRTLELTGIDQDAGLDKVTERLRTKYRFQGELISEESAKGGYSRFVFRKGKRQKTVLIHKKGMIEVLDGDESEFQTRIKSVRYIDKRKKSARELAGRDEKHHTK